MNTLTFSKNAAGVWQAKTPKGAGDPVVVQLKREKPGYVRILANLDGFEPEEIAMVGGNNNEGFFRKIDWPSGVVLTIESETPVTKGGYE